MRPLDMPDYSIITADVSASRALSELIRFHRRPFCHANERYHAPGECMTFANCTLGVAAKARRTDEIFLADWVAGQRGPAYRALATVYCILLKMISRGLEYAPGMYCFLWS
jgi:hypothetical protein